MLTEFFGAARVSGGAVRVLSSLSPALRAWRQDRELAAYARGLLGLHDPRTYGYRVAQHHPIYSIGSPHPDDCAAFGTILKTAISPALAQQDIEYASSVECSLDDGHVIVGSPESDPFAQAVFGYHSAGEHGSEFVGDTLDLPFRWEEDARQVSATYTKFVPGRGEVERPNWPIVCQRAGGEVRRFPEVDGDGFSATDWLVLTRIPNIASLEGLQRNRSIVSVAGAHGTATRAIELLVGNRHALAAIGGQVPRASNAFQALIEVGGIRHNPHTGSRASTIRVDEVVALDFTQQALSSAMSAFQRRWSEVTS